ncbi:MAG TPA: response regulator [Gammaproteobacteria bacterium]
MLNYAGAIAGFPSSARWGKRVVSPDILKATRFARDEALEVTLRLMRARSSRYAWYGTFIAACAVVIACMLVAQHFYDGISYDNVLRAQRENLAIWVLDCMPFLFALWGQAVSFRTTRDAGSAIMISTSSLRRSLREERVNARRRTDYFAKLSHEFRTPLNSILGMTDILAQKPGARAFSGDIKVIHAAAENLLTLINDVLDHAAIEAGQVELDRVEFDLRECVTNACSLLRPQARAKGLSLELDIEPGLPRLVTGDPGRLRQVLVNLVGNAIKFTSSGSVCCRVAPLMAEERAGSNAPRRVSITITDTGRGMDERTLKRLFRPYSRVRSAEGAQVEGTGLGLAICREIVEAMGGNIHVVSEPGKGSTFTVEVLFEPQQGISIARIARSIEVRGVRLLLVEAPSGERDRFEAQLRTLGLDVRTVDDGVDAFKEALQGYVHGRPYEILITDLFAEHLSGDALARALKARPETRDICLVAITGSGSRGDGKRAKEAGFSGYLAKPIPPEHLGELLRASLATLAVAEDRRGDVNLITRHYVRENAPREVSVLLVEDERVGLEAARNRLQGLGCRVTAVVNAGEALDALEQDDFHLVLLDYNLPDGRGDEIVRRIMGRYSQAAPPIVMFSAGLTQAERQRCLRAGAVGFLEKPATRDGLLSVLERHCRLPAAEETADEFDQPEVVPALRRVFIRESLTRLAELEKATGSRLDRETVYRTAHAMRSSSRHVGAAELSRVFAELEDIAQMGDERLVRARSAEVAKRWREVIDLLEDVQEDDRTVRLR